MNNGNLLNTLMGVTSANTAAAKTTAAKSRAESSEKFQQALDQARPEVAARKPAARKEPATSERSDVARSTSKTSAQRSSQQEANRAYGTKKTQAVDRKTANGVDKSNVPAQDLRADRYANTRGKVVLDANGQSVEPQAPTEAVAENLLLADPSIVASSQASGLSALSDSVSDFAEDGLVTDSTGQNLTENDISPLLQDPGLLAGILPVPPSDLPQDESVGLSPLLTSAQAGGSQAVTSLSANAQASAIQVGKRIDELMVDGAAVDTTTEEGNPSVDTGENPDFLLLNSKAALNKLAEANMTANTLDKAAPAADLTRPAAVSAAVETLARLTEAQSPAGRGFVVQTGVPVTVGTPQWSQAVGDKVLWLAAQNVSSAEIRLDPPELGPMQVKVSVNQDQTSITFTSPHSMVRDALDQQLHRLREMFSEQGLNLVNVDVSDKSFAQQERDQDGADRNQGSLDMDDEELAPVAMTQAISLRLVDHYA